MARFDAYNSECLLFSFKDGLLARLAHDLKLQVERFSIEVDESDRSIQATFDPSSISVVCAQIDGRDDPSTLSKGDKKKIYDNVTKDVLRVRKFPDICFDSTNRARSKCTENPGGFRRAYGPRAVDGSPSSAFISPISGSSPTPPRSGASRSNPTSWFGSACRARAERGLMPASAGGSTCVAACFWHSCAA